jgi:hypothetical protein
MIGRHLDEDLRSHGLIHATASDNRGIDLTSRANCTEQIDQIVVIIPDRRRP